MPKKRRYLHFDFPLSDEGADSFVLGESEVASRAFFPLLGYDKVSRKPDFSVFPVSYEEKKREIRYAGHVDSAIYSQYAQSLGMIYEEHLADAGIASTVLAYRGGIGNNVTFARDLFHEVGVRGDCAVVCLDISKFFDNLDHKYLKAQICSLLNKQDLPIDWYKIYRRLTSFEYVIRERIEQKIGRKITGRRICDTEEFHRIVKPLIKKNANKFGIPQGTPLSGLLANVYMMEFDRKIRELTGSLGGSYRRYSDDIALVLPTIEQAKAVMEVIQADLAAINLAINADKTCSTTFTLGERGQESSGDLLQYLGFTFDGSRILLRSSSIKKFYANMKSNIKSYVKVCAERAIPASEIRKRVLVGRFTHWGDDKNFVQYAYKAAISLNSPRIKRQLRNHVAVFARHWEKMIAKYY